MVLRSRGVAIPAEVEARIQAYRDTVLLSAWLQRAVTLSHAEKSRAPFQPSGSHPLSGAARSMPAPQALCNMTTDGLLPSDGQFLPFPCSLRPSLAVVPVQSSL